MAQILHFLRGNSIHVMAITESWLGKSIDNNSIELPGVQVPFRRDRHKNGGGVCLYISENLACKRREDLEQECVELIRVEVYLSPQKRNHRPLLVGCCYRPPSASTIFYEHLETVLDKVTERDILLLGDFNAKHQDWFIDDTTNCHGTSLRAF